MSLKHPINALMSGLMYFLTACAPYQVGPTPDEALFERGSSLLERGQFTSAHLIFETLINTYPDSSYADKARLALQDQRIAVCADEWSTSTTCNNFLNPTGPSKDTFAK